ncbi:SH3 domain-containing protein [Streptomyces sp. NBC_00728]|uniref:SH3 domain-containing protein n=2 Tax=unclassified Streptomyces TaxID=2593676 RepID=UPI0038696FBA
MSLRSTYTRIGMALAAGSLVALAGATPALADGEGGTGSSDGHQWSNGGGGDGGGDGQAQSNGGGGNGHTWSNGGGGTGNGTGTGQTSSDNGGGGGQTWNNGGGGNGQTWNSGGGGGDSQEPEANGNGRGDGRQDDPRLYKGRVTARGGLALRSSPTRGSQLIRVARQGEIVSIFCKTSGQTVEGNPLWYLLTDGTWAWGAARYIDNIGPSPRWC